MPIRKFLLVGEDAKTIQNLLIKRGGPEECLKPVGQIGLVGQFAHQPGIEQTVEDVRAAGDRGRQPRRRAHDVGDQPQELGIGLEQGEKLDAGRQALQELVENAAAPRPRAWSGRRPAAAPAVSSVSRSRASADCVAR